MTGEVVSATGDNIYSLRIYPVFCNQKKSRFHSLSLYQRAVGVFAPLGFTPLFCNQKKSCFHSPAVPDGVPGRRIFSIPVLPSYTDGSPAFSHEKSLAAKRGIIIIPSAAGAAPPLKGRGRKSWRRSRDSPTVGGVRAFHRGAEKCTAKPRREPRTGEPRFALRRRGAGVSRGRTEKRRQTPKQSIKNTEPLQ